MPTIGNILWIDDEILVSAYHRLIINQLESEGHKVFLAPTNNRAERLLRSKKVSIDLVIQDIMRPEGGSTSSHVTGIHFFEDFLRNNYPTIPCIFHSARLHELSIREAISTFQNCHCVPFGSRDSLLIVIKSILSEKERLFEAELDNEKTEDFHLVYTSITKQLVSFLAKQPEKVYELSSRTFEELIAELLTREGFMVTLTPHTRDGGLDIYALYELPVGNILTVVECKKYNKDRPVSVDIVRSVYGVKVAQRANKGLVVTTSYFTQPALDFKKSIGRELSLKDYDALKFWLSSFRSYCGKNNGIRP